MNDALHETEPYLGDSPVKNIFDIQGLTYLGTPIDPTKKDRLEFELDFEKIHGGGLMSDELAKVLLRIIKNSKSFNNPSQLDETFDFYFKNETLDGSGVTETKILIKPGNHIEGLDRDSYVAITNFLSSHIGSKLEFYLLEKY